MAMQRTSAFCQQARPMGYDITDPKPDRVIRDAAAAGLIPAELRGGCWWYNTADVHKIAATLGWKRLGTASSLAA